LRFEGGAPGVGGGGREEVKKVLISTPSKDSPIFVYGVNALEYRSDRPNVISCSSCTTNYLAPIAKVLNANVGISQGLMTTVHASTRSQHVLDGYIKRDRRADETELLNCSLYRIDQIANEPLFKVELYLVM